MLNMKLLEKERVENRFTSYEVYIDYFFYNVNATVSFGNCLTMYIFRFKIFTGQTEKLTDGQNKLLHT